VRNLDTANRAIVSLGDSLTAGVGAAPGADLATLLARAIGRPVHNAGVSGDTTEAARRRIGTDVLPARPGIVLVCLGGNDFLRRTGVDRAEENLTAVVREIQGAGAMVVLCGFEFPSLSEDWGGMYARVAAREQCLAIPDLLDGIEGNPALKADAIHPNEKGYALMADRLAGPIGKLIARAGWRP
jgi:lysophospholipase L1-like esterase